MRLASCIRSYSLQKEHIHKQSMIVVFNMFALFGVYVAGVA